MPPARTLELRICDPSVGAGAFLLELVRQLGERVIEGGLADDAHVAKRLVAIHCAYGVDIDRFSVRAAQLSLSLECRADAMPLDWLDGNIRHGDALVGLTREEFARFHWKKDARVIPEMAAFVDDAIRLGAEVRTARMAKLAERAREVA